METKTPDENSFTGEEISAHVERVRKLDPVGYLQALALITREPAPARKKKAAR